MDSACSSPPGRDVTPFPPTRGPSAGHGVSPPKGTVTYVSSPSQLSPPQTPSLAQGQEPLTVPAIESVLCGMRSPYICAGSRHCFNTLHHFLSRFDCRLRRVWRRAQLSG